MRTLRFAPRRSRFWCSSADKRQQSLRCCFTSATELESALFLNRQKHDPI